jgi:hypothetical protein
MQIRKLIIYITIINLLLNITWYIILKCIGLLFDCQSTHRQIRKQSKLCTSKFKISNVMKLIKGIIFIF